MTLLWPMKIRTTGSMERVMPRQTGKVQDMIRRMTTAGNLDRLTAALLEFIKKLAHVTTRHLVTSWMRNDGNATCRTNPA